MPKKWLLEIEQEANRANLETDLVLDAQLEEMDAEGCDEHAEVTIMHELIADLYAALRWPTRLRLAGDAASFANRLR